MQLTRFTDYSLRVLMYLAARPTRLARIQEIAEAYDISRGHVMKVVHGLGEHGFVRASRGRTGGIRLARPASDIQVGDVVRKTEENLALVPCFADRHACVIEPACGLHRALDMALDAFLGTLDEVTLDDLVRQPRRMARLLQIT